MMSCISRSCYGLWLGWDFGVLEFIVRQDKEKAIQLFICLTVPDKENEHQLFIVGLFFGYK
jgi:hypothetical protein